VRGSNLAIGAADSAHMWHTPGHGSHITRPTSIFSNLSSKRTAAHENLLPEYDDLGYGMSTGHKANSELYEASKEDLHG
jgi:hypothetical protein